MTANIAFIGFFVLLFGVIAVLWIAKDSQDRTEGDVMASTAGNPNSSVSKSRLSFPKYYWNGSKMIALNIDDLTIVGGDSLEEIGVMKDDLIHFMGAIPKELKKGDVVVLEVAQIDNQIGEWFEGKTKLREYLFTREDGTLQTRTYLDGEARDSKPHPPELLVGKMRAHFSSSFYQKVKQVA